MTKVKFSQTGFNMSFWNLEFLVCTSDLVIVATCFISYMGNFLTNTASWTTYARFDLLSFLKEKSNIIKMSAYFIERNFKLLVTWAIEWVLGKIDENYYSVDPLLPCNPFISIITNPITTRQEIHSNKLKIAFMYLSTKDDKIWVRAICWIFLYWLASKIEQGFQKLVVASGLKFPGLKIYHFFLLF